MLTTEDVLKIAKLSKLEFNESEIEKLNKIDTTNIEPLFNVLDLKDRLRKDEVVDAGIKKEILNNAPNGDEEFIIVPKVVGGENVDN